MKKTLQYGVYLFFFGLIAYSPVARGLFFRPDYTRFFMVVSAFFIAVLLDSLLRRTTLFRGDIVDWGMLALSALYALSSIKAVSKLEAVDGALRYAAFLLIYITARHIAIDRAGRTLVAASVFASALVTSIIGLGTAVELMKFPGAYQNLRIFGSLQYPNALAAYAMFASFTGYYLWSRCSRETAWLRPVIGVGMYVLTTVILSSQSRITWLTYPVFLLLYAILAPAEIRGEFGASAGITLLSTLGASPWFLRALSLKQPRIALAYLLAGAAGVIVLESARTYLVPRLKEAVWRDQRRAKPAEARGDRGRAKEARGALTTTAGSPQGGGSRRGGRDLGARGAGIPGWLRPAYLAGGLAAIILLLVVSIVAVPKWRTTVSQLMPVQIARRFTSISLKDRSLLARLFSLQDAFAIARDYPLLGTGAGGWDALYHQYQKVLYYYTETHSHFGQVAVETGFTGFIAYTAIWAGVLYAICVTARLYRRKKRDFLSAKDLPVTGAAAPDGPRAGRVFEQRDLQMRRFPAFFKGPLTDAMAEVAAFGTAALSLGAHSALDFELSLPAVMAALLSVIAALVSARDSGVETVEPAPRAGSATGKGKKAVPTGPSSGAGKALQRYASGKGMRKLSRYAAQILPTWRRAAELIIGAAVACAIWFPASAHLDGMKMGGAAVYYAVTKQDYDTAKKYLYSAAKLDPYSSEYALNLARIAYFQYKETGKDEHRNEAKLYIDAARKLRPTDIRDIQVRAGILNDLGFLDESVEEYSAMLKLVPLSRDVYEAYSRLAMEAAIQHAEKFLAASGASAASGDAANQAAFHKRKLEEYVASVLQLPETMAVRKARITGLYAEYWDPKNLDPSPRTNLYLGQACYLAGDGDGAVKYLSSALSDSSSRETASAWLHCVSLNTGKALTVKLPIVPDPETVKKVKPMWGLAAGK